jgi:RNA methyltransferase, TrmH family
MYGKFLVEGDKNVREILLSTYKIDAIWATPAWAIPDTTPPNAIETISDEDLKRISTHTQPDGVIALANIPALAPVVLQPEQIYIYCDNINDPGNAGSIIRIADWFGLGGVIMSPLSVDLYNPKTVSAAKGSLYRVPTLHASLADIHTLYPAIPIIGAAMTGTHLYDYTWPKGGVLVVGNEANGISESTQALLDTALTIPAFGGAESLNAAIATGILISDWRRQQAH